ncbi:MAG: DUF3426 domain-containing protein [Pseudomonadota bacterium]|nr:DUF3426 domain-containing protein [Pseudomonadota bacterium]
MRTILLCLLLAACADPLGDAQKVDTIEAWESYLGTDPSGSDRITAETRLEQMLVERALKSSKLDDYDAVLKRFPKSRQTAKVQAGRAVAHFVAAEATNTPEAWKAFIDQNPAAEATMRKKASARVQVAGYQDKLVIGEVTIEEVNLAEDPKGPKDGWGFSAEVTNTGDKTLDFLTLEVQLLDASGTKLAAKSYPLAGTTGPGGMSLPEEYTKPLKPGDKRVWVYTMGDVPEGWSKQVRVVPTSLRFNGSLAASAE